ncbi:MAG: hypothetical protein ABIP93_12635 [Gemmatimonadaceae bacterium]
MSDETAGERGANAGEHGNVGGESALAVVGTLMEERRKYENWLGALEARRGSTPERVFTRVHADYSARLDVVLGQLSTHSGGLRAELGSLTSQLSTLEERQQSQRDERAEAELRAHVGELTPDAWQAIAASADTSIEELTGKHSELERELLRTRELLHEAERPATPRGAAAVPAEPKEPAPAAAPAAPVEVSPAAVRSDAMIAGASSVPSVAEGGAVSRNADTMRFSQSVAVPAAPAVIAELSPALPAAEALPVMKEVTLEAQADRGDSDVTPLPTQRADASRHSGETAGTFDELAFLSSVVDTPMSTVDVPAPSDRADERARRDSFAQRGPDDDIVNLSSGSGALVEGPAASRAAPLAMNVTGNTPIVIKEKSAEAAKSLKCSECGSMNYPTEWYCERCGAELASL